MAIKHQTQSYRNRNGRKFICWQDCLDQNPKIEAQAVVRALKAQGKAAFYETQDGGAYCRVFVEAA